MQNRNLGGKKKVLKPTSHHRVHHTKLQSQKNTISRLRIHQNGLRSCDRLTFANALSGIPPSHRSSTLVILFPDISVVILTTLLIVCSIPIPLTLYLVFKSTVIGFSEEVTEWCSCSISEKATLRPYHCAWYCLRPSDLVRGSENAASSWILLLSWRVVGCV